MQNIYISNDDLFENESQILEMELNALSYQTNVKNKNRNYGNFKTGFPIAFSLFIPNTS